MAQRVPIMDFTGGLVSPKFSSRIDLPFYMKGCSILDNWLPLPQGGITYMPGTTYKGTTYTSVKARLIPFIAAHGTAFLLEITPGRIQIWGYNSTVFEVLVSFVNGSNGATVPYSSDTIISEIHVGQYEAVLYLVQKDCPVYSLQWNGGTSFTWGAVSFSTNTGHTAMFSGSGNYPAAIAAIGGRMAFGGTTNKPTGIWISVPFDPTDFTFHEDVSFTYTALKDKAQWTDPYEPETEDVTDTREVITAANAFEGELASDENESIVGMVSSRDLIICTTSGEWVIPGKMTAIQAETILQSRHGGTRVQPIMTGAMAYLVTNPRTIKAYQYADTAAAWAASDISFQSEALSAGVVEMDYAQHPIPTIYCVLANGTVAICTLNQGMGAITWSLYKPANSGLVESLAVIPGTDGDDDVYMTVLRGSARFLELLERPLIGRHLAAAVTPTVGSTTLTGLAHLNGMAVSIVADGATVTTGTVAAGAVAKPAGTAFRVGLSYLATMRTMRPPVQRQEGVGITSLRRVAWTGISLYQTRGIMLGALVNGTPDAQRPQTPLAYAVATYPTGFTGDTQIEVAGDWDRDGWLTITKSDPTPATILALLPEVE